MSASAAPATPNAGGCRQVPRLRRKWNVNVTKCYVCHAKWRGAPGDQQRPSVPPEPAKCNKCHACLAKRGSMSPSATPATRNAGRCRQSQPSAISATLATRNKGRCREVPGLACVVKVHAAKCHAESVCQSCVWKMVCERECVRKRVCDKVVCERECVTKLCVKKLCVKRWCVKDGVRERECVTKLCVKDGVWKMVWERESVWQSCVWQSCVWKRVWQSFVWKMGCERECVTKLCVKDGVWKKVCDKVVCERWCVTKLWWQRGSGGGGGGGGTEAGRVQNQKQKPHTKMWGKNKKIERDCLMICDFSGALGTRQIH